MNKAKRNRLGDSSVFLCFESTREKKMFHVDTEWAYKHLVMFIKWTSRLWNKNSKRRYLVKSWGKTGEYTKNLEQVIFNYI